MHVRVVISLGSSTLMCKESAHIQKPVSHFTDLRCLKFKLLTTLIGSNCVLQINFILTVKMKSSSYMQETHSHLN